MIKTKAQLDAIAIARFPDNQAGLITPALVREHLLDQQDSIPVVAGSSSLTEIAYIDGRWQVANATTQQYAVVTREDGFNALKVPMLALLAGSSNTVTDAVGGWHVTRYVNSLISIRAGRTLTLDAFWPLGEAAPIYWKLSPARWHWIKNYEMQFETWQDSGGSGGGGVEKDHRRLDVEPWSVDIDGVPYHVASSRTTLARPVFNADWTGEADSHQLRMGAAYIPPPQSVPTFVQVLE